MSLWKTERAFSPLRTAGVPARHLDPAALAVIGAALVLMLFWLVPLRLALPVLSMASFAIAGIVALIAHHAGIDRRAPGLSAWDIAAVFTLIWIGAGMMSGSKAFSELFESLVITP